MRNNNLLALCLLLVGHSSEAAARRSKPNNRFSQTQLNDLDYAIFPRRTEEEAAVLEWGHSAIISALDASVARFGPQTSQAALLEVECQPVLASPLNGNTQSSSSSSDGNDNDNDELRPLDNADEVHGNMVVMTNNGGLTGVQMAQVAKLSGAAALLVVNINDQRPDDIYRLPVTEKDENDIEIDIPVVMISLNSANVLTTATVTPGMEASEIVNHGMPERVRLYAGGDRPFFEDVEQSNPTLYLIWNLLTKEEANDMKTTASTKVSPIQEDVLQLSTDVENFPGVERVMLWQGVLQTPANKAIEERIEQVTGFPSTHYSDWIVDKLPKGSHWKPHYDTHPYLTPMATITVFLTDEGGSVVYPSAKTPVKIQATKGMAIVHHNSDERGNLDYSTVHALLEATITDDDVYVARKFVFTEPVSKARRMALPAFAFFLGGKLPGFLPQVHDLLVEKFGNEQGSVYFDKVCVFLPVLVLFLIAQSVAEYVQAQVKGGSGDKKKSGDDQAKSTRRGKKGKKEE